jgi:hypothetical protein
MSMNSLRAGKFLLTAGLLLVLVQGLYQFPDLQDYLFPGSDVTLSLRTADIESHKIENGLLSLVTRVDYLRWFMAQGGPDQQFSMHRMLSSPFSESIRFLSPGYCWQANFSLAQKNRVQMERKLRYLEAMLTNLSVNLRGRSSHDNPAILPKKAAVFCSMNQIQQLQAQCMVYNSKLIEITKQLAWFENNGYKN